MKYTVYNFFTNEEEFTGTHDECQDYIGNYGGGWTALEIKPAPSTNIDELYENLERIIDRIEENELQGNFPSAYQRAKEVLQKQKR